MALEWTTVLTVLQLAIFVVGLQLVRMKCPNVNKPWELADSIVSPLIDLAIFGLAFNGALSLSSDLEGRWHGTTLASEWLFVFYMSRTLAHTFVFPKESSRKECIALSLHHAFTLVACMLAVVYEQMHFFCSCAACVTITSIFLGLRQGLKDTEINGRKFRDECPYAFATLSALVWASFLVFRFTLLPLTIFFVGYDLYSAPEETWGTVPHYMIVLNFTVACLVFVESLHWFIGVHRGFMNALRALPMPIRRTTTSAMVLAAQTARSRIRNRCTTTGREA